MYGMPSIEFWEGEPQLYWAYRFSYEKSLEFKHKKEGEMMRLSAWLEGKFTCLATSIALQNSFLKKKKEFPSYEQIFKDLKDAKLSEKQIELNQKLEGIDKEEDRAIIEFNYWARL